MKYFFLTISFLVIFLSCENEITNLEHSKYITNSSDYNVKIIFEDGWQAYRESNELILLTGQSENIFNLNKSNNIPLGKYIYTPIKSIVLIDGSLQSTKDANNPNNWLYESFGNRSLVEKCTLVISNQDFEP